MNHEHNNLGNRIRLSPHDLNRINQLVDQVYQFTDPLNSRQFMNGFRAGLEITKAGLKRSAIAYCLANDQTDPALCKGVQCAVLCVYPELQNLAM